MTSADKNEHSEFTGGHQFTDTRWSLVLIAGEKTSVRSTEALETLCRIYCYPLSAYVRRKGHSPQDAQDLTQGFFVRILKNNSFASADREKGKFRTDLLGALNHFLADEWDKARAEKRGGGDAILSLDDENAERPISRNPVWI